jgi:ribulose-bisphosphate carboxylase large chain
MIHDESAAAAPIPPAARETGRDAAPRREALRAVFAFRAATEGEARAIAEDLALEQSVEVPADCVPARLSHLIGAVEALERDGDGWRACVALPAELMSAGAAGLLNLLFGNVSLKPRVRLVDMRLPPVAVHAFAGPRFGVAGLRAAVGAPRRPLTATALKPVGLTPAELARRAAGYARGGVDIVKDDHNLMDQRAHPFEERVARCQEAVAAANAATGGSTLYAPMIAGPFERLDAQAAFARSCGVRIVLTAPMLVGVDAARSLAARHDLALMAHPSFAGAALGAGGGGVAPALLLGALFRLFGADLSIFPNAGGRFAFDRAECVAIADALRAPMGGLRPAMPAPAGGMALDRVGEMVETFGRDVVLLIGGALMRASPDPERAAALFRDAVERAGAGARA